MFKGTFVAIRSINRIRGHLNTMRESNETSLCNALRNKKSCQNRPKMAIEYQPDFSAESAQDALLDKKKVSAYVFLDSRGNIEKTEIALPNGTVLKSTPEKKDLN